jgi:hypothetical protein
VVSHEYVGPDEMREDLAGATDRQLIVRAINELLFMRYDLGALVRDMAGLTRRVERMEDATQPRVASHHDWSEELARLDSELTRRVKDPDVKFNSERATEIAVKVVKNARNEEKALAYDKRDEEIRRLRFWAITFAVGTVVTFIVGHFLH